MNLFCWEVVSDSHENGQKSAKGTGWAAVWAGVMGRTSVIHVGWVQQNHILDAMLQLLRIFPPLMSHFKDLMQTMDWNWLKVLDKKNNRTHQCHCEKFFWREKQVDDNFPKTCNDCAKPVFHVARSFNWVMARGQVIALCIRDTTS